jgi:DNA polymerase V
MTCPHCSAQPPPLFASRVPAGFPSPADDYIDKPQDLNDRLVPRPAATLFLWMPNDALQGIPIWPGDLLIADRSIMPKPGRLVLARVLGEVLARRLVFRGAAGWLVPANPNYPAIALKDGLEYAILGVGRHQIHRV